ncbi:hypothetical protein [Muricoccus roseus]|uniref:hypothetical protein n=1 Tax=Muricoccus roseus TaxID=198092 RepID=UPI00093500B6|nr:hypothetical protein [Roseomonas rosea]
MAGIEGLGGWRAHSGCLPARGQPAKLAQLDDAGTSMQGMNHANMPGMNHGNMQGMQGHNMSGMSMQDMMAHCRQMQADTRAGRQLSPDMQAMMEHCNMMGGSSRGQSRSR